MNLASNSKIQSSELEKQSLDFAAFDSQTQSRIQKCTFQIKSLIHRSAKDLIDIGQNLIEVKKILKHGNFEKWLKVEFDWSLWTARKFMKVAEQFGSVKFTEDLSIATSALYLLAAPSTPEKARTKALERASQGEKITYSTAKNLVNEYASVTRPKTVTGKPALPAEISEDISAKEKNSNPPLERQLGSELTDVSAVIPEAQSPDSVGQSSKYSLKEEVEPEIAVKQEEQLEQERIEGVNILFKENRKVEALLQSEVSVNTKCSLSDVIRVKSIDWEETHKSVEEVVQTFEITSTGVKIVVEVNPEALIILFEQMQLYPSFAQELFRHSRLLDRTTKKRTSSK